MRLTNLDASDAREKRIVWHQHKSATLKLVLPIPVDIDLIKQRQCALGLQFMNHAKLKSSHMSTAQFTRKIRILVVVQSQIKSIGIIDLLDVVCELTVC